MCSCAQRVCFTTDGNSTVTGSRRSITWRKYDSTAVPIALGKTSQQLRPINEPAGLRKYV